MACAQIPDYEIVRPHLGELREAALRLTGTPEDADDLVQECLLLALPGLAQLRRREALGAWLLQILRYRWYERLRRRTLERRAAKRPPPEPSEARPPVDAEGVRRALARLGPEDRRLLELRFFQTNDSARIAAILGKPRGTVRSMIFYALRKFEAAYLEEVK